MTVYCRVVKFFYYESEVRYTVCGHTYLEF